MAVPADEDLLRAAAAADRGPWTKAGRALQKKFSRPGSAFPAVTGPPETYNTNGQVMVRSILDDPARSIRIRHHALYGIEILDHSGRDIRYDDRGEFLGFLEP